MPEHRFPRYFTSANPNGFADGTAYIRWDSTTKAVLVGLDGTADERSWWPLAHVLDRVRRGEWKEISAAQAAALVEVAK